MQDSEPDPALAPVPLLTVKAALMYLSSTSGVSIAALQSEGTLLRVLRLLWKRDKELSLLRERLAEIGTHADAEAREVAERQSRMAFLCNLQNLSKSLRNMKTSVKAEPVSSSEYE